MKTIAIDGACRRNGKPDCISAGSCFILVEDNNGVEQCFTISDHETESTSQRGELTGLLLAFEHIAIDNTETVVITDSEYLFNTITKRWVDRWMHNQWQTADGSPVKNQDLWTKIWNIYIKIEDYITMFHIKGHLLSVGMKKYHDLMYADVTGYSLYQYVYFNKQIKADKLDHALALSEMNNGFRPDASLLQKFAAMNVTVDAVANLCIEAYESAQWRAMLKISD